MGAEGFKNTDTETMHVTWREVEREVRDCRGLRLVRFLPRLIALRRRELGWWQSQVQALQCNGKPQIRIFGSKIAVNESALTRSHLKPFKLSHTKAITGFFYGNLLHSPVFGFLGFGIKSWYHKLLWLYWCASILLMLCSDSLLTLSS